MNDPILQDKRQEHVMFQKYAVELMERVSGKSKMAGSQLEASMANMHKVRVSLQTSIGEYSRTLYTRDRCVSSRRQMSSLRPRFNTITSNYSK